MNKKEQIRLQKKRKRLRSILIAEAVVAVLAIAAAAIFTLLPQDGKPGKDTQSEIASVETTSPENSETDRSSEAASSGSGESTADPADESKDSGTESKAPEGSDPESGDPESDNPETQDSADTSDEGTTDAESANDSTETESGTESAEETSDTETAAPEETPGNDGPDYTRIVFVGDSRTKTMASGGRFEFRLVPDDSVCATWGGQLIDESAFMDAAEAAAKQREKAVFWFGINDVQLNPERDNPAVFIANYDRVLSEFRTVSDYSSIYLLAILPTSVNERDYYEGQDDNINAYNEALRAYASEHGYIFLDITPLYTGEECFAEGDQIHFSEKWYRERFIPAVTKAVGI